MTESTECASKTAVSRQRSDRRPCLHVEPVGAALHACKAARFLFWPGAGICSETVFGQLGNSFERSTSMVGLHHRSLSLVTGHLSGGLCPHESNK